MAYFGGNTTERAWNGMDFKVVLYGLVLVVGTIFLTYTVTAGPGFGRTTAPKEAVAAAVVKPAAAPIERPVTMQSVLVPVENIYPGQKLTATMFKKKSWPVSGWEDKVVSDTKFLDGKYTITLLVSDTPVLQDYISISPTVNRVTEKIPVGFRAVTIAIDALSGVEGWVEPGSRVDVVWATNIQGRLVVTTLVENSKVLSAEKRTEDVNVANNNKNPMPQHVTLLVSIRDAQKIQLAKEAGSLSLNLRGDSDTNRTGSQTITLTSLLRPSDIWLLDNEQGKVTVGDKVFALRGGKLKSVVSEDSEEAVLGSAPTDEAIQSVLSQKKAE